MLDNSFTKIILLKRPDIFRKKPPTPPTFRIVGEKERNEIDGSEGAIITLLADS